LFFICELYLYKYLQTFSQFDHRSICFGLFTAFRDQLAVQRHASQARHISPAHVLEWYAIPFPESI
jgi:hypothetical protein